MVINKIIPKRYIIDKLKYQMKIDKKWHAKTKLINYKIKKILYNNISSILLFYLLLLLFPSLSKEINILISSNEIIIKIKGKGNQKIINDWNKNPSQIYINNESQSNLQNTYNLENETNEVKIVWDSPVNSCNSMFLLLVNITEVDLSKFDASQVTDMNQMFQNCTSLTSVNLNISYTGFVTDLGAMFYGCHSLEKLDLSHFNSSSLTNMCQMLFECFSLTSLNLDKFKSSSVTNFYQTFFGLQSIKSIDLSNFDTSSAENMFQMFLNCFNLEYLDLSNFETSNVNNMHEMFFNCRSLTSIDLSSFDTSKVTIMNRIFYDCKSLEFLDLSNFNTSNLINMEEMFSYCYSLKSLDISSFDTSSVTNIGKMFRECQSLEFLDISNFNTSKVQSMNEMFFNCISLTSLELGNLDTSFVTDMNKIFYNCHSLLSLNLFNFNPENKGNEMFYNVSKSFLYCANDNNALNSQISNGIRVNCSDLCSSISKSKYIAEKNKCISDCSKDDTYKFEYNYICYSTCQNDSYQYDNHSCKNDKSSSNIISNEYNSDTTNDFYKNTETAITNELVKDATNNLGIISDLNVFHEFNKSKYSYEINTNLTKLQILFKNRTFIDLSQEVIDFIYKKFELNKEKDKIYILIDEFISEEPRMVTNDYNYRIFLENGTELNLSLIDEDIYLDIYLLVKNKEVANFNYIKYFFSQGYDIYDKNSEFYNDFCTPAFLNENDITLEDRKKYIYPNNITLCKNNCKYKKADLENERIICLCNINSLKNISDEENDFLYEDDGNFISYLLDKINYKIFQCYKAIKSLDNLKINLAFYIILLVFFALSIINFIFLFYSLPKLIKMMYVNAPTPSKVRKEVIMELKRLRKLERNTPLNKRKKKENKSMRISQKIYSQKYVIKIMKNNDAKNSIKNIHPSSEKSILKSRKRNFDNERIKNEDLNDLPFTLALNLDKRSIVQIFYSLIIQKLEIINLFISDEKVKLMIICEYILSLLINFFFNALLYSDEVISNKYHNNGKLDFIVTLILSISSNIITSIICYYVNYSKGIDERYELIMKIKKEYYYLKNIIIFSKYLKIKFIYFFICELLIICSSFYYIVIFFFIYSRSIGSLIVNYFSSLFESFLTSIIICIIIASTRKIGLVFLSKKFYNTSKYINKYY